MIPPAPSPNPNKILTSLTFLATGFWNLWNRSALGPNVTSAIGELLGLHPGAALHVTGHSMGAAVAQICALDAKARFGIEKVWLIA